MAMVDVDGSSQFYIHLYSPVGRSIHNIKRNNKPKIHQILTNNPILTNNKSFSAVSQSKSIGLVWGLAATRRSVYIHQMNRMNSRKDSGHHDSTINTVVVSIIIIIIIIKLSLFIYYYY